MFVRFRFQGNRLQASLVQSRRAARKVHAEHVGALGSVDVELSRLDRSVGSRYERRLRETRRANVSRAALLYSIAAIVSRAIRARA
jgi:sigma54-dependent transcription regulator